MGNTLGHTNRIDTTTLVVARGKYARVCFELHLSKPLIPFITILGCPPIGGVWGLHIICFNCGRYEHREEICPTNKGIVDTPKPHMMNTGSLGKANNTIETASAPVTIGSVMEREKSFGPWMLPRHLRQQVGTVAAGRCEGSTMYTSHQHWVDYFVDEPLKGSEDGTHTPQGMTGVTEILDT